MHVDRLRYLVRERLHTSLEGAREIALAAPKILAQLEQGDGWQPISSAPKGDPVQVISDDSEHHWLPMTASWDASGRWYRPASRDGLPYEPTHWRPLPPSPHR